MNENINQQLVHVFRNNAEGVKVFEYLKSRFYDTSIFKPDPYTTAYNAGQHDLILQLINMMNQVTKAKGD